MFSLSLVTSMTNLLHPRNLKRPQHLLEKEGEGLLVVVQRPVQQSQKQLPNHLQTIKKIAILRKNISKLAKVKRAIMDLQKMAVDLIMSLVKMNTSPNLKKPRRVVVAVVFEDRLKKDIDVVLTVFRMTMTVHLLVRYLELKIFFLHFNISHDVIFKFNVLLFR